MKYNSIEKIENTSTQHKLVVLCGTQIFKMNSKYASLYQKKNVHPYLFSLNLDFKKYPNFQILKTKHILSNVCLNKNYVYLFTEVTILSQMYAFVASHILCDRTFPS